MKKIYLSLIYILLPVLMCNCQVKNSVVVQASLDSIAGAKYNGQMAYLFAKKFTRCQLIDSCLIDNNTLTFKATLTDGYWAGEIITSGKEIQTWSDIQMAAGNRIQLMLDEKGQITNVSGSPDTQLLIDMYDEMVKQGISYRKYRDSLPEITDEALRRQIKDSMDYYDLHGRESTRIIRKMIYSIQHAGHLAAIWYEILGDSADSGVMVEVADYLCQKFPGDKDIMAQLKKDYDAMRFSDHSDTLARNFELKLLNCPPLQPRETKPIVKATEEIAAYRIGDIVLDFRLPGYGSQPAKLSDSKAPYVFIDFWATWCGPCRNEIPHVVAAKQKYGKELDVFAVSLDYYSDAWKKYIDENDLSDFTHVLLLNNNPLKPEILARFGCSAIPRNFLLDKDRRIIAIDLRGEALEQKMKELAGSE